MWRQLLKGGPLSISKLIEERAPLSQDVKILTDDNWILRQILKTKIIASSLVSKESAFLHSLITLSRYMRHVKIPISHNS